MDINAPKVGAIEGGIVGTSVGSIVGTSIDSTAVNNGIKIK